MAVYRRSARPRYTLVLLVLTAVTALTLDERGFGVIDTMKAGAQEAISPIRTVSDIVMSPIGDFVGGILHYGDLEAENNRLRRENNELRNVLLKSDDAVRENEALRDQLGLEFVGDIPTVAARVVSASPSNHELSIVINRGRNHGVADRMPVVTSGGLVGRVANVSATTSVVVLMTDRTSGVGVRLASGDVGVAGGDGPGRPLQVDGIDSSTAVEEGEVVVTSGLQQSLFPPNIPVGTVKSARKPPGALQQAVTVEPSVDLGRLTFVTVLQWSPLP